MTALPIREAGRWPRMMKRATAAEYCDMTEQAFEREILAGRLPASIHFGGREHWDKVALDSAISRLTGDHDVPDYIEEFEKRYGT